jgi:hypothetical protein
MFSLFQGEIESSPHPRARFRPTNSRLFPSLPFFSLGPLFVGKGCTLQISHCNNQPTAPITKAKPTIKINPDTNRAANLPSSKRNPSLKSSIIFFASSFTVVFIHDI